MCYTKAVQGEDFQLVVDDNSANLYLLIEILRRRGMCPSWAKGGG